MQVGDFTGGKSIRLDATLIDASQAVTYTNIDNTKGTLTSEKGELATTEGIDNFFYLFKGNTLSSNNYRDYVEYGDTLYFTEDGVGAFKYKDGVQQNLGIAKPVAQYAVDSSGNPIFHYNQSQWLGLVTIEEFFANSDFLIGYEMIDGIAHTTDNYLYRLAIYNDNRQIFIIDILVNVPSGKAVKFNMKTNHIVKLGRWFAGFSRFYKVDEGRDGVIDYIQTMDMAATNELNNVISGVKEITQYTYTYYNSVDGTESAPAELSSEYDRPISRRIKLTNFTMPLDRQVDYIRVYRLNADTPVPALLGEYPIKYSGINPYVDPVYDLSLGSELTTVVETYNFNPPPTGLKNLVIANNSTMYGSVGRLLYFNVTDKPNAWPAVNSIQFEKDITGLLPTPDGLIVFMASKCKILVGTSVEDYRVLDLSDEHGCISHRSCKKVKNVPVWVSYQGICGFQSGGVVVLSRDKLGEVELNVKSSAVFNESYMLLDNNNNMLCMDLKAGLIFRDLYLNKPVHDINVFDNILYVNASSKLCKMFKGDLLELTYDSPKFNEGSTSLRKLFNVAYIRYSGTFEVKVYINDILVQTKVLPSGTNKLIELKVPQDKQAGETIQYKIKGIGTIYEIEYKVVGRKNGR